MNTNFFQVFSFFRNKHEYFRNIREDEFSWSTVLNLAGMICLLLLFYGFSIGAYQGVLQSVSSAVKLVILFSLGLLICFPSFYIVQLIIGSKIKFRSMLIIILSGAILTSWILVAFIPIVVFFMLTGGNYYFLILLHIAILIFSGLFGMLLIIEGLRYYCEEENIYPRTGVVIFRIWIVIYFFVSIQLGWTLRPFLGDKNAEFKLFRQYKGNFYTAVIYSIDKLFKNEDKLPYENFFRTYPQYDKLDSIKYDGLENE